MSQKTPHVRSKAILEACREIACQVCGADDGTVVAAHSNQSKHGKGMGIKADDRYVAAMCSICHHQIDQGFLYSREERNGIWDAAHDKTVEQLQQRGLWPKWIPYEIK
jgi:hypothetical protein